MNFKWFDALVLYATWGEGRNAKILRHVLLTQGTLYVIGVLWAVVICYMPWLLIPSIVLFFLWIALSERAVKARANQWFVDQKSKYEEEMRQAQIKRDSQKESEGL